MNKLFLIISFFAISSGFAQEEELYDHGLDQNKWQDIRDGIRYEGTEEGPGRQWTYEDQDEYYKERERYEGGGGGSQGGNGNGSGNGYGGGDGVGNQPRSENYSPPPQQSSPNVNMPDIDFSGLGIIGWILLVVFIVGLIVLIFFLFLSGESKGKKITPSQEIDFDEVNPTEIPLTELQRLLQEAIARKDYRSAVRIYFIFIVRDLAEKRWIIWEKEKTNFQYLREMTEKKEFDDFNTSVSYFEIIWYGKREIDEEKFEQVKPKFTRLLDKLGVK